jgi:hypothetical protein
MLQWIRIAWSLLAVIALGFAWLDPTHLWFATAITGFALGRWVEHLGASV